MVKMCICLWYSVVVKFNTDLAVGESFENTIKAAEDNAFPTMAEIMLEQNADATLWKFFNESFDHWCICVVDNTELLVCNAKYIVIPEVLHRGS